MIDYDARPDMRFDELSHAPRIVAVAAPVDVAFVARELDAERVIAGEFDATLIVMLQHMTTTRRTLAAMRDETPHLPTLTTINVLYDIVTAIRRPVQE